MKTFIRFLILAIAGFALGSMFARMQNKPSAPPPASEVSAAPGKDLESVKQQREANIPSN